jgi:SAM-dependent methyltransferase
MNKEAENNRQSWEHRSSEHQNELRGVLFKRFPESLNQHIHKAHISFVLENIKADSQRILDAGCGYGRISSEILKKFQQVDLTGMDMSENYAELYKENTGRNAFQGNMSSLPENIGLFDLIICVTVLMYVPKRELEKTLSELLNHLNENGKIVLIEPLQSGKFFSSGFGLMRLFSKGESNTAGNCFVAGDLKTKIKVCGGTVIDERRAPFTTFFIIPLFLLAKLFKQMGCLYKLIKSLDNLFGKWRLPSLHTFLVIEKTNKKM